MIKKRLENYGNYLADKYKDNAEEFEIAIDTHNATIQLYSELDAMIRDHFNLKSDLDMLTDDHAPGETYLVTTYVNDDPGRGITYNELPTDSATLGMCIETNHIDIQLGGKGCLYIDVKGPTGYLPAFNDKEFAGNETYSFICDAVWKSIMVVSDKMMKPTPKGGVTISVTDQLPAMITKWVEEIDDKKNIRTSFMQVLGSLEILLNEVYDGCSDWSIICPNSETESRYIKLFLFDEDSMLLKQGLDLACIPSNMSMLEFSFDKGVLEVTIGTRSILSLSIMNDKPEIKIRTDQYIMKDESTGPRFLQITKAFERYCADCFE